MIDKNSQFMAILTNVGAAKLANANALGIPWKITAMAVGDANGTDPVPSAAQTKLVNEVRRAQLNQLKPDEKNLAVIIAEQVIPENIGGFWIREIGLYDEADDLIAVANCAPTFKPLLAQGSGRTQIIRMNLIVSSTANIELKIDPSVVLATRQYVDGLVLEVLPPDKVAGKYFQVEINKRGIVVSGRNPTKLAEFGITDGVTKTEFTETVGKLLPKSGGTLTGNVLLSNGTEDSPEFGYITPTCEIFHDVYNQNYRIFGKYNGAVIQPLLLNFPARTAYFFGFTAWHSGNFDPASKADSSLTYKKSEVDFLLTFKSDKEYTYSKGDVDGLLAERVLKDSVSVVGFASNDPSLPYMRRASDGKTYFLQPSLGYVPVQQGTGVGQTPNAIKIGWSSVGLKATVDNVDLGVIWCRQNFDPASKADVATLPKGIGVAQTWLDLTSARTRDVAYTNTTGRAIAVSAWPTNAARNVLQLFVDGVEVARNTSNDNSIGAVGTVSAIVPPGSSYVVASNIGSSVGKWLELR